MNIDDEIAALRRMAIPRLPSRRIAAARMRIKRRLRRLGVYPAPHVPTWGLIGLSQLPGVRERQS